MRGSYHQELKQYLESKEVLLWSGKPKGGIVFRLPDLFLIPFSLAWTGVAIYWVVLATKGSVIFSLFGIPLVVIGLMLSIGRFFMDAKLRDNTVYGITEERIIIKRGVFKEKSVSVRIKSLTHVQMIEKRDGSGTIIFEKGTGINLMDEGLGWWMGTDKSLNMNLLPNVKQVYQKIVQQQIKSDGKEGEG